MLLAKSDLTLGTFASAKINFEYALKLIQLALKVGMNT